MSPKNKIEQTILTISWQSCIVHTINMFVYLFLSFFTFFFCMLCFFKKATKPSKKYLLRAILAQRHKPTFPLWMSRILPKSFLIYLSFFRRSSNIFFQGIVPTSLHKYRNPLFDSSIGASFLPQFF